MEVIVSGRAEDEMEQKNILGVCTQEPGDNCWMQLD